MSLYPTHRARSSVAALFTGAVASAALVSALVMPAQAASPERTGGCTERLAGVTLPGVQNVGDGEKLCLKGVTVTGAINVSTGGALAIGGGSVIEGAISAEGARGVRMCNSATTGSGAVEVLGTTGTVRFGDLKKCAGNSINGAVTLNSNTRAVKLAGNTVVGAVTVNTNNALNGAIPMISNNTISGALSCEGNTPAPDARGHLNVVGGEISGQCAELAELS